MNDLKVQRGNGDAVGHFQNIEPWIERALILSAVACLIIGFIAAYHLSLFQHLESADTIAYAMWGSAATLMVAVIILRTYAHYHKDKGRRVVIPPPDTVNKAPVFVPPVNTGGAEPTEKTSPVDRRPTEEASTTEWLPMHVLEDKYALAGSKYIPAQALIEKQKAYRDACVQCISGHNPAAEASLEARSEALKEVKGAPKTIVISGAGVSGLITARQAFEEGAHVILLEKRESYTRDQILRINKQVIDLETYLGPELYTLAKTHGILFKKELDISDKMADGLYGDGTYYSIVTKDLEWLLALQLQKIAKLAPEGSLTIKRGWEFKGFGAKNTILISKRGEQKAINADLCIGADGNSQQESISMSVKLAKKK